jgi:hypothetical protein
MGTDRRSVERLTLLTSCAVRTDRLCRRRDRTDHRVVDPQADKLLAPASFMIAFHCPLTLLYEGIESRPLLGKKFGSRAEKL